MLPMLTRRNMLKNGLGFAASSLLAGRGASLRAAAFSASAGNQPYPSGSIAQVPITLTSNIVGAVPNGFVGLAYSKEKMLGTLFTGWDPTLIGLFKRLGPSILRIGGSTVDDSVWDPGGPGGRQGYVSPADVNNLAAFLKATGWKCIYGINLGGAATGATNPSLAGQEAAYVYKTLGSQLASFEIGNEPDFYGRVGNQWANDWSFDKFMALWNQYRTAIVRAAAGAAMSGPADAGDPTTWTVPFGEAVTSSKINMLTQHYYVTGATASNATLANLLDVSLHRDVLRELAALKAASQSLGIPFRMNECGDFYSSSPTALPNDIAGSYTSALWSLDYMFMCAQGGASGVNFESGGNVWGFPPLLNEADYVCNVCPLYYGMLLFTLAGTGTGFETVVSPGSLNVTAYGLHRSVGGFSMVVLNKEFSQNIQLDIVLPRTVSEATLIEMNQRSPGASGPNIMATSGVTIQGSEVSVDGSFSPSAPYHLNPSGNRLTCYVPPLSAVLIQAT
jgi:hypothetical protein